MGESFPGQAFRVGVRVFLLFCFFFCTAWSATLNQTAVLLSNLKGNGSSSWNTSDINPCNWKGVNCSGTDVINISLAGFDLAGSISPDIGLLQHLVTLHLFNNSLTGNIPPNLSNCTNLSTVNLSTNQLSGPIPPELGNLHLLQILDLSQNALSGTIPTGIGNLTSLQKLNLDLNSLTGPIPPDFVNLAAVTDLSLSRNLLTGSIPEGISLLAKLESFSAYQNNLSKQIPSMKMPTLKSVNLASNNLSGAIPQGLCASGQLNVLVLTSNFLDGSIPEELGSCTNLSNLRLGENLLYGEIPQNFGQLENLVYFEANQNNLSGHIPSNISNWKNLTLLNLAHNSLTGGIPAQLSQAVVLQELLLSNNKFSGSIPQEISQCKSLSKLDLSENQLTGSLPDNICSLPKLTNLQLGGNALSGIIPSSIGDCAQLLELLLGDNKFNGSIPSQIGNLVNLQVSLNLSLNELTGSIPDSLGKLVKLVSLDLSYNQLSGPIPAALGSMASLLDWNFSNNLLTGPVPSSGPLANSSASSFANNIGLCGGPLSPCLDAPQSSKGKRNTLTFWKAAGIAIACAVVALLIISGIAFGVKHEHRLSSAVDATPPVTISRLFSDDVAQAIDFDCIKEATGSNSNVISKNHFSTLYKAVMPSGLVLAAKKLHSVEKGIVIHQRKMIFELDKMWKLSHDNIMQPVGYYLENDLAIIIYDFVPSCSLGPKLHRNFESLLAWSSRYEIAIGAAQGIAFLHHSCNPPMMHMDVGSNNIFLGPNSEVKVGDAEVTKLLDPSKHTGSISAVAGSFGYIAPEYAFTMRVTLASNIYSFGVVLLELLTGRRPVDESFGDGLDIVRWVHGASLRGEMPEQVLDARISSQSFASRQEMLAVLKVALLCTNASPLKRPRMKKVLEMLQEAKVPAEAQSPASS